MKLLIKKILKETINDKLVDFVMNNIESGNFKPPYFKLLSEDMGLNNNEIKTILKKIFGGKVTIYRDGVEITNDGGKSIYNEVTDETDEGWWSKTSYDKNGNLISKETKNGWAKWEYDRKSNLTYFENDQGTWEKLIYDDLTNKIIYKETSSEGVVKDLR